MRFIDSNVLAYASYQNKNQERCQQLIKEGGIVNTVNLIEAYNTLFTVTDADHATQAIRTLLKSNLCIVPVDINLLFEALKRNKKYKLLFNDLLHYITALLHNCSEIASYDTDFDGLEIKRIT